MAESKLVRQLPVELYENIYKHCSDDELVRLGTIPEFNQYELKRVQTKRYDKEHAIFLQTYKLPYKFRYIEHYFKCIPTDDYEFYCEEMWHMASSMSIILLLSWMKDHKLPGFSNTTMNSAAMNGNIVTMQWLNHAMDAIPSNRTLVCAVLNGQFKVVEFLIEKFPETCDPINAISEFRHEGEDQWMEKWVRTRFNVDINAFIPKIY